MNLPKELLADLKEGKVITFWVNPEIDVDLIVPITLEPVAN